MLLFLLSFPCSNATAIYNIVAGDYLVPTSPRLAFGTERLLPLFKLFEGKSCCSNLFTLLMDQLIMWTTEARVVTSNVVCICELENEAFSLFNG